MPATFYANDTSPDPDDDHHIQSEMAQIIAISSGKGGAGKSTLASNLGIALRRAGKKVCLFDTDTNLANIDILLGTTPLHTLAHFFKQDLTLKDIIIKGPEGIDIIAGPSGAINFIQLSHSQRSKLIQGMRSLEKSYEYLLIDTAADIEQGNLNLLLAAPYLILSITQEPTSLTDAYSLLRVLQKHGFNRSVMVIVNMTTSYQSAQDTFNHFKTAVTQYLQLTVYFAGHVLADPNMQKSVFSQQAILLSKPDSPASECIFKISKHLLNAFDMRLKNNTSLSDHLEAVILSGISFDYSNEPPDNPEFIPSPETGLTQLPTQVPEPQQDSSTKSALLRASYFARKLNEK